MAKGVMPLRDLLEAGREPRSDNGCQERIIERFLRALGQNGKAH